MFLIGGKTDLGDSALDFFQNGEIVAVGVAAVVDDEIVEVGLSLIAVKAGVMDDNLCLAPLRFVADFAWA